MFLFPKSIVYFFKNGYFTNLGNYASLQNLVPSLQRIKIQHCGQCGISGFSASPLLSVCHIVYTNISCPNTCSVAIFAKIEIPGGLPTFCTVTCGLLRYYTRNTCLQQPLAFISKHCFNMKKCKLYQHLTQAHFARVM